MTTSPDPTWTPFGEFDPKESTSQTDLSATTNPFFQRLEDVVFDPFIAAPGKTASEEKVFF